MKISELEQGSITDALVALAQEWENHSSKLWLTDDGFMPKKSYTPSSGNAQTFDLIEKFKINLNYVDHFLEDTYWVANSRTNTGSSTPAISICKAVIASKWGDEIPDEIMEKVR